MRRTSNVFILMSALATALLTGYLIADICYALPPCQSPGSCTDECILVAPSVYSQCKQKYAKAIRNSCGLGIAISVPCGVVWNGGAACPTQTEITCGSGSFIHAACDS